MTTDAEALPVQLSQALAAQVTSAQRLIVAIRARQGGVRTGTLWRPDTVLASEQVFAKVDEAEILGPAGVTTTGHVAGRDPGTNIVALRLDAPIEMQRPGPGEAKPGGLVLTLAADRDAALQVRLGIVRAVGPAWHSQAGGRIDRRIWLDLELSADEEGGPVVDVAGAMLGMSTAGPGRRGLVIPGETIERVLDPLLRDGRIDRGWLGAAFYPVALPAALAQQAGQNRGLMVLRVVDGGPAGVAGVVPGDILLAVGDVTTARPRQISRFLGPESIGQQVTLRIVRAGALLALAAEITARPIA